MLWFVLEAVAVLPWVLSHNTQRGLTVWQFDVTLHWCNMSLTATPQD